MRPRYLGLSTAVLLCLVVFTAYSTRAQNQNSGLQTGLFPQKSTYDRGELVVVKVILYNPTSETVVVHFRSGCWYSFSVRSQSGGVVHNETWPTCGPSLNGYENVTNVMTLAPGGGRWTGFSWDQRNSLGFPVATPATYILSWRFATPDITIPEAMAQATISGKVSSQLESISWTASLAFQEVSPLLWSFVVPVFAIRNPMSAPQFKRIRWPRRLLRSLPVVIVTLGALVLGLSAFLNQLYCEGIQCGGTIELVHRWNLYLLAIPLAWPLFLLAQRRVKAGYEWIPYMGFETWTLVGLEFALFILIAMQRLWQNMFFFDWSAVWPSYALILAAIPANWIFYRVYLKSFPSISPNTLPY